MKLVKEKDCEYWVNDKGQKHGEYKSWHSEGQLREHSFYVNDQRHGEFKIWHENGQLGKHCFYVNGENHGEYKWWLSDGQLGGHSFFVNGKEVRDLIKEPVTDEDKFLLALETGAKWLDINS